MRSSCVIILILLSLVSCRSTKEIQKKRKNLNNISERQLFRNIAFNELEYNTLHFKKMSVSLKTEKQSNSFKATMRMKRDSFIWISLTAPLGIEVARVLLTPDSVKFINSHDREYFLSDYTYFEERFDVGLNFDCIQKLLTNQFFNFELCTSPEGKMKRYKFDKTGNNYLLYTLEERALGRKVKKLYKKKQKHKEYSLILQKIEIDPDYFRPCLVSIEDLEEQMGMSVKYDSYKDYESRLFPEKIFFKIFSGSDHVELQIICNRMEFDIPVDPNFKISAKYKRVN